mmetsp:Transcript_79761/g.141223  ORF Transcript_79761/g.141223 Transcript_79761/m.141223 type:complete len:221 (+) Transcript_79761:343-1005(+)
MYDEHDNRKGCEAGCPEVFGFATSLLGSPILFVGQSSHRQYPTKISVNRCNDHPLGKSQAIEIGTIKPSAVQLDTLQGHLIWDVTIVSQKHKHGKGRERIVQHVQQLRKCQTTTEKAGMSMQHVAPPQHNTFVHEVTHDCSDASICLSAMAQKQVGQEAELRDCNIACLDCAASLFASDAHSDMCTLNHRNIIGTVTDGQRDGTVARIADQLHQFSLLQG